ncbi:hypothetical protein HOE37_02880 [Candidatus Woesearchaeota archaeon]|jgi:hypothetical protein|nr:hypothetical protein [Candidatus Woesearchaeota archaeon]MBT4110772.1 hypothetical protein [Candidatus Woesearchaeota archaeon]MBT4336716.1 hypothetical protein [Candidatus Woesearchaeota archaeon]MBT4469535.1 hypothetical protein [Candidatus Woesearchaeota archaeon]MBT6743897.1 hypothetical protein [Candidatus Woesearchaeota archaeon]
MGGQPFKAVDMISLVDDTYSGLSKKVQELVRGAEYHEKYHQKGNFVHDPDTNEWRVEVEYSVVGGLIYSECPEMPGGFLEEREGLELRVGLEIMLDSGVDAAKEYLGYEQRSNDDCLASLKEKGLPETAKAYGVPEEALLAFQGLNIRRLQEYFDYSLKRPVQVSLAEKLGTTRDFLEDLRRRKLA